MLWHCSRDRGTHSGGQKPKSFLWETDIFQTITQCVCIIVKCDKHNKEEFLRSAFLGILYPAKLSFSSQGKAETFSDVQQRTQFLTGRYPISEGGE